MNISPVSSIAAALPAQPAAPAAGPQSGSGSGGTQVTAAERKKAAAQFEAILVRQLLSQSVGSMMGGTGHTAGLMYGDMMTDVLAQKISEGNGLGLGKMIDKQLTPKAITHVTPFNNPSK